MMLNQQQKESTYFEDRMAQLGITEEINSIGIRQYSGREEGQDVIKIVPHPIFRKHQKGIQIMAYTLNRSFIAVRSREEGKEHRRTADWSIIRLEQPIVKEDGSMMKYVMPKGAGSNPFFPPALVDKYERREKIKTLFLTEGFFKAMKGSMCGLDIVGLPSITHLVEKATGQMHSDILELILKCEVERVVWLTDGDCLDIPSKLADEYGKLKDLHTRPQNFYNSIFEFRRLLNDYDVEKYFMHIDSENIGGHPKGLDDLLIMHPDRAADIVADLVSVSKPGEYVQKFNITTGGIMKVRGYFHLSDVTDFYLFHSEKRRELKGKEFVFAGTQYRFDEKENRCVVVVPAASKQYFRVGDYYYKFIRQPNQKGQEEVVFVERKKTTILDDHGKNFINHVPKYESFCNVPDHVNFQPVISGCFNVYSPMDYKPDEDECTAEDCPTIIGFLKHIFGSSRQRAQVDGQVIDVSSFEMGLDYFQVLYEQPVKKLPILCLVSKENSTGKSTLGNFMRLMFGANVAIVGNKDLAGEFNAHWSTKLVVVCDEAKIEKHTVVETVKMLSTARKITMNSKGKNQTEIDCFIKFVMISNNEDSFIYASDEDIRFWVLKVPQLKGKENPKILEQFAEEMPAFLSFLSRRRMVTTEMSRMWFHPNLIKTDALKKLQANSEPMVVKEIRANLREMFMDFGVDEIRMSLKDIHKEFFNCRFEKSYLERALKEHLKADQYHTLSQTDVDEQGNPVKEYKTTRYTFPKNETRYQNDTPELTRVDIPGNGRPYIFLRKDFLTESEMKMYIVDDQQQLVAGSFSINGAKSIFTNPTETIPFG